MNLSAWAQQRARYSRARRGRNERGASLAECAAVEATAVVLALAAEIGAGRTVRANRGRAAAA